MTFFEVYNTLPRLLYLKYRWVNVAGNDLIILLDQPKKYNSTKY
jgi:hypothetical protein